MFLAIENIWTQRNYFRTKPKLVEIILCQTRQCLGKNWVNIVMKKLRKFIYAILLEIIMEVKTIARVIQWTPTVHKISLKHVEAARVVVVGVERGMWGVWCPGLLHGPEPLIHPLSLPIPRHVLGYIKHLFHTKHFNSYRLKLLPRWINKLKIPKLYHKWNLFTMSLYPNWPIGINIRRHFLATTRTQLAQVQWAELRTTNDWKIKILWSLIPMCFKQSGSLFKTKWQP